MANGKAASTPPGIVLLSGLPGAGKTTFAHALLALAPGVHVESDAIRRRLAACPRYTPREHATVFARAERMAADALARNALVVVDATNLVPADRRCFVDLARLRGLPLVAVRLSAPLATLQGRLAPPREGWSQAGLEVLQRMQARPRPFTVPVVVVDTRYNLAPSLHLVLQLLRAAR